MSDERSKIFEIKKLFLCNAPLSVFNLKELLKDVSWEEQKEIVKDTVENELVLRLPIKIDYQKAFLKEVINILEKQKSDVHDDLYSAYGRLVAQVSTTQNFYKHYCLDKSTTLSLEENINLISRGTTGLRTWQASLALSQWAFQNKHLFENANVIELGSGVGLAGLAISLCCDPSRFIFTDCHPAVLDALTRNIELNIKDVQDSKSINNESANVLIKTKVNQCEIQVVELSWEDVTPAVCSQLGEIDIIIAADVVYDSDLFGHLINATKSIMINCNVKEVVFACTERNPDTLASFQNLLSVEGFQFDVIKSPEPERLFWPTDIPIKFLKFHLKL